METEQAQEAVQPMEAAPVAGAENGREQTMSKLLDQLAGVPEESASEADPSEVASEDSGESEPAPEMVAEDGAGSVAAEAEAEEERRKARNFRGRWDHLNEQERRVVELTTKRGLSLTEAYRAVYGTEGGPLVPGVEDAGAGVVGIDVRITEQQQRLEELKRRKTESKGDLAAYDEASEAYMDAREQLRELRAQRSEAAKVEAQQMLENRERLELASRELVEAEYPEALVPGTDLYEACSEELAYLREQKSPLANDPQAHYKVARRMARSMGYQRQSSRVTEDKGGAEASAGMRQSGVVPRRSVRPVPTGGQPVEPPLATLERRVSSARSTGEMLELMREIGTPFEVLLKRQG